MRHYHTASLSDVEVVEFGNFKFRYSPTVTKSLQWAAVKPCVVHGTSEALYASKQATTSIMARAVGTNFTFIHANLHLPAPGNIHRIEFFDETHGDTYTLFFMRGTPTTGHRIRVTKVL
jgi:hypothetical protein